MVVSQVRLVRGLKKVIKAWHVLLITGRQSENDPRV